MHIASGVVWKAAWKLCSMSRATCDTPSNFTRCIWRCTKSAGIQVRKSRATTTAATARLTSFTAINDPGRPSTWNDGLRMPYCQPQTRPK